jgi:hypothetical protein
MCKPFGEVSNVTQLETHTTRIRGMFLWLILQGYSSWTDRLVALMYESTLDSASQAWCVSDYPVTEIILAARADIVEAGLAPRYVLQYQPNSYPSFGALEDIATKEEKHMLFYPGDAIASGALEYALPAMRLLRRADLLAGLAAAPVDCGGLALCLGRRDLALAQAEGLLDAVQDCTELIVDGPLSLWALEVVLPSLGLKLPDTVQVIPLLSLLLRLMQEDRLALPQLDQKAYVLGSEFTRLTKPEFQPFKQLLAQIPSLQIIEPVDGLRLADGSGVGGALHIAAPDLADQVSSQRIDDALAAGAQVLVSDSPLDAAHLQRVAQGRLEIRTLPWLLDQEG